MKQLYQISLALILAFLAVNATAQDKTSIKYALDSTTVAIVPLINASGEKDSNFKARQIESGLNYLTKAFTDRGFKLTEQTAIAKAIGDLKIDLNDEENHNKATLYKLGKEVNADLIVFAVITSIEQHMENKVFVVTKEGRATVKMWLLDVKNETPLLSAVTKQGKSGGPGFADFKKGSDEIIHAVANGERDLLKEFFKPYPLLKKEKK